MTGMRNRQPKTGMSDEVWQKENCYETMYLAQHRTHGKGRLFIDQRDDRGRHRILAQMRREGFSVPSRLKTENGINARKDNRH